MRRTIADKVRRLAVDMSGPVPRRALGKTGLSVTQLGLGGGGGISAQGDEDKARDLVRTALSLGINYIDTAAEYGPSEKRIGAVLGSSRPDVVLATKTQDRTRDGSLRILETSLKDLKTDYIDIWQIHHIDDADEVEQIFKKGGAIEALQQAKEEGTVKHIGITGHYDPKPLKTALGRFNFDTVLLAVNAADVHKNSFIEGVLPEAVEQELGIIGMKIPCMGRIFHTGKLDTMKDALDYVLTLAVSTAIVGVDSLVQLYENVMLAKMFKPLSEKRMKEIEELTKEYAHLACFFRKGNEEYNPFWKSYAQKKGKK